MTQQQAIEVMMSGANVFLTGAPGAGKTYVLNKFVEMAEAEGKVVAVTASTGIAASHIGGVTIHSWSGLGIIEELAEEDIDRMARNNKIRDRYREADILVIDEISMLAGKRLAMVDTLAKKMRRNQQPFGGLQVIIVGDMFQLPPVDRYRADPDFVHLSYAWETLSPKICYITEQHRQETADGLLELLIGMRSGAITDDQLKLLTNKLTQTIPSDDSITRLYSHNIDVDEINERHLRQLEGKSKHYRMTTDGDKWKVEALLKGLLAPPDLELKVGAEVMFVANNFDKGFVNGTRGRIKKFTKSGEPIVELLDGETILVDQHKWTVKENDHVVAEAKQIPLRLAWAITIHKSQGMSLDAAQVDLSKAFTTGMGYVALSRVRSLDGLYLEGLNQMALEMHPGMFEFDNWLRQQSEQLAKEVSA